MTTSSDRSSEGGRILPFPAQPRQKVQVTLWEGRRRPKEDDLRAWLMAEGYAVVKWQNEPATGYPPHLHIYPELLWVLSGDLTLLLPAERRMIELTPGDRAELPAGTTHGTMSGADGAVYLLATR